MVPSDIAALVRRATSAKKVMYGVLINSETMSAGAIDDALMIPASQPGKVRTVKIRR
jgi:hypothetical protein